MSHIGICVSDWKRSLRFYHDLLGFRFVYDLQVDGEDCSRLLRLKDVALRAIYLEREGVRIELLHYASPGHAGDGGTRPMNQLGLTHLSLRVDDLDAILAEFEAASVNIQYDTRIDSPATNTKVIFISDPDGTLIEFVQQPGD